MFGRKLTSLTNYSDVESKPLSPEVLEDRWRVMRELVWPETAANLKASQQEREQKADKRRVVHEDPYPVHTYPSDVA